MSLSLLGWLFALGVVAHNAEEAWLLPGWSKRPARWRVNPRMFHLGALVLSLLAMLAAWLAEVGGRHSFGAYLLAGYALAMVLNVLAPHLVACLVARSYAPGTATALLLNLPLGGWLIHRSLVDRTIEPAVFAWSGPLVVLGLLAFIPVLFVLGGMRRS
ncbi:HXXEE domain-containing protein [Dyella agri]|uniref:HXXEE domain-containing protein n=1 Tax=Dyella agri TaxID=1926869 RepID=A0ABW8KFU9_9GAMM